MAENQLKAYRVCSADYIKPHNGYGSTLRNGGRWNSPKHACIYSGSNRSIAQLEWLSHSLITPVDFPKLMMITYAIPGRLVSEINLAKHPDWLNNESITKVTGDKFLTDNEYMALKVPSTLDVNEYVFSD